MEGRQAETYRTRTKRGRPNMKFLPKDQQFFDLFEKQSQLIVEAAEMLDQGVTAKKTDWNTLRIRVHQIENKGDDITHETLTRLHRTFITPMEPQDIHDICLRLDDVLDMVDEVAGRFHIFKVTSLPSCVQTMTQNLVANSHATSAAVRAVAEGKDVSSLLIKIHDLEDEADQVNHQALTDLFDTEKDPIRLIKLKEIIELLEEAADSFEGVAHVLEAAVVKNA